MNTKEKEDALETSSSSDKPDDDVSPTVDETDQLNYTYMFAIMPRFIPIDHWNKDVVDVGTGIDVYKASGKRPQIS